MQAGVSVTCTHTAGRTFGCWVYFKSFHVNNNGFMSWVIFFLFLFAKVEYLHLERLNMLISK